MHDSPYHNDCVLEFTVPEEGPVPQLFSKKSESLNVTWSEIPQRKRRGCLKKYTVYLKDKLKGDIHNFSKAYLILRPLNNH